MTMVNPLPGDRFAGYELRTRLSESDLIYSAQAEGSTFELCLSVRPVGSNEDRERCEQLTSRATGVAHPNVAAIVDSGFDHGYHWLATHPATGSTLEERLETGRMGVDEAVAVTMQILAGLRALHAADIVHGHLRAEHVCLSDGDLVTLRGGGMPAPVEGPVLTRVEDIVGTAEHLAPEQILGDPTSAATDLYATGLMIYRMLTGELPFASSAPATLIYHQLNEPPKTPSLLNAAVPPALDRVVAQLLMKVPDQRPGSATQVMAELEAISRRHELSRVSDIVEQDTEEQQRRVDRHRLFEPVFVGRDDVRRQLRTHAQSASQGNGRLVCVAGEAGIGKTRLVDEVAGDWRQDGHLVVQGSCFFGTPLGAYVPILDALSQLLAADSGLTTDGRQALAAGLRSRAPSLAQQVSASPSALELRTALIEDFGDDQGGQAEQIRFLDVIHDVLADAAARRPLVIILEDMHWSDTGTLQVLLHLARRVSDIAVLLVVTYRPDQPGHATEALLQIMRDDAVTQICHSVELARLSATATKRLAQSLFYDTEFSASFDGFLFGQSEGNPFIATETLKLLRNRHLVLTRNGIWQAEPEYEKAEIPARVEALVHERLEALSSEERQLLQLAAVAGTSFTAALLEQASGLSRVELLGRLFKLEGVHRLLSKTDEGFAFSHSMIREVLYAELPGELCREYHRILSTLLAEATDVADADLGHHLLMAELFAEALPPLCRAADEAAHLFSWHEAARLGDDAYQAARESGAEVSVLLELLSKTGRAYGRLPRYEAAMERLQRGYQLATDHERSLSAARLLWEIGDLELEQGHLDSAHESFADVAAQLTALDSQSARDLYASTLIAWGSVDFESGRMEQAASRWQEAHEQLARGDNDAELSNVLNNQAVLATVRGDLERAWELYEQALTLDAGRPTSNAAMTLYNMGMLRADQERWNESLALFDRAMAICDEGHFTVHRPVIDLNRAEALIGRGEPARAREMLVRALDGFRRLDDALGSADTLRLQGRLCRIAEDWEEGRRCLEQSIEINRRFGETVSLGEALSELGLLHSDAGSPDAALPLLQEAEQIFERIEARPDLEKVRQLLEELSVAPPA